MEEYYDEQFEATIMPEEYRDAKVNVFCNDCEKISPVPFHILGGKCGYCRSYNTMRDKGDIYYPDKTPAAANAEAPQ